MMIRGRLIALCGAVLATTLAGCAGGSNREAQLNRSLTERNRALMQDNEQKAAEIDILQDQLRRAQGLIGDVNGQLADRQTRLDALQRSYDDLDRRLGMIAVAPLDPETDQALADLAARYPNMISFDSDRGMLRFASDLTFDSGSATLKAEARNSLNALGEILTSSAAAPYELHIIGHTDSQRISANTARTHPTNMHLACHRAISVRGELAGMGVTADRMLAGGWGEHRPIVPNTAKGNTPPNRRVEIYLTRRTGAAPATANAVGGAIDADQTAPPSRQPDPTK